LKHADTKKWGTELDHFLVKVDTLLHLDGHGLSLQYKDKIEQ
jgi:hypothetical protein